MAVEYLGAGSPDGTLLGRNSTDKIAFYNTTPVVKQSATLSAAITAGATTGATNAALLEMYNVLKTYGLVS